MNIPVRCLKREIMKNRFDEKVVLVIGVTGGIGSEVCRSLKRIGCEAGFR